MEIITKKLCPNCSQDITNYKCSYPKKTLKGGAKSTSSCTNRCPACKMQFLECEIRIKIISAQEQYESFLEDLSSRDLHVYDDMGWPTLIEKAIDFMKHFNKTRDDFNEDLRYARIKFNDDMTKYFALQK